MVKCIASLIILTSLATVVRAQGEIEPNRPTESVSAALVGKGGVTVEAGFKKIFNEGGARTVQLPNLLLRYGLLNRLELRVEATREKASETLLQTATAGIKPLEVGLKASLYHNRDSSFMASLFGQLGMHHAATKGYREGEDFHRVRLLFQNELSKRLTLSYNVGREWDSDEKNQNWMYTVSPEYVLSSKWILFAEAYSTVERHHRAQWYSDAGIAYAVGKQVRLDLDAGKGLSANAASYFITTGISVRF